MNYLHMAVGLGLPREKGLWIVILAGFCPELMALDNDLATSLCKSVPKFELGKFCHSMSIVAPCCQCSGCSV